MIILNIEMNTAKNNKISWLLLATFFYFVLDIEKCIPIFYIPTE